MIAHDQKNGPAISHQLGFHPPWLPARPKEVRLSSMAQDLSTVWGLLAVADQPHCIPWVTRLAEWIAKYIVRSEFVSGHSYEEKAKRETKKNYFILSMA